MSLITCPDCGNNISTVAVACPNCGRPMAPAIVEPIPQREVIIQEAPRERGFPPWLIAPIIILGAVLVFALFYLARGGSEDEANSNINVRVASEREAANARSSRVQTDTRSSNVTVPSTSVPSTQTSEVTVPPSQSTSVTTTETRTADTTTSTVATGKSSLSIDAKIRAATGREQPVQRETFYLLKKDLRTILEEADIDDEEGQGLVNAFGMSIVYPGRYPEIRRKALAAISKYTVAKTLTDAQGKAKFPEVKPDSYYLFGITKTPEGFSVWDTPVTLSEGAMNLNLEPSGAR
ncbi:MAG TPA: hypothetical protein VK400_09370 [Pyrinomonadaceae bacterium]|nr:hypothetical protein [Pyrinomonadaceae bacterium]